jgi:UDP-N-acetylmuramate: L-alanyl-gamma-D-glutamyl-meso-diaminopimelate ligase
MLQGVRHIHFIGICGTAMGAVAAAMHERGFVVTGSDASVYPPMSTFLESRGIRISSGYKPENIPADAQLVVIGNAISRGNEEAEAVLDRKLLYLSLPELLRHFFLHGRHNLVVTGTHGKTTTTSLLTWIFESAGQTPSWLIGGLPANLPGGCVVRDSRHFILEGDEYDTAFFDKRSKFVHYLPELVIVNNIEFDHADIFGSLADIVLSFRRLLNIVPRNGMILLNADDPNCNALARENWQAPVDEVGFSENAAIRIRDVSYDGAGSRFTLFDTEFTLAMVGEHNVRNAAMAIAAAKFYGIPLDAIRKSVAEFAGVKRRQEIRGVAKGITVMDDFGHHPTAIRETLMALRHRFPKKRLWAVFEPRSNTTRRAVFQDDLPKAFDLADGVVIAQVARLDQLAENERLNPEKVVAAIARSGKPAFYEPDVEAIIARLKTLAQEPDVIVVFSNGGFGNIHERLLKEL